MHKKLTHFTVDFYREDEPVPEVGTVLRYVSAVKKVASYFRIRSVRPVQVRVSRGEVARYALGLERLERRPEGEPVKLTTYSYVRKAKKEPDWLG